MRKKNKDKYEKIKSQRKELLELTDIVTIERAIELLNYYIEDRLVILPEDFMEANEFYKPVFFPINCDISGDNCCECDYYKNDDCIFKPYVITVDIETLFNSLFYLYDLKTSKEEAESCLSPIESEE